VTGSQDTAASGGGDSGLFDEFHSAVFAKMGKGYGGPNYITFNAFGWLGEEGIRVTADTWIGFSAMFVIAAAGGLLLNFIPCALPLSR